MKRIELTDKGRGVFEGGIQARQAWLDDLASTLSDEQKLSIATALKILIQNANQLSTDVV